MLDHDEVDMESIAENNRALSLITDRIDIPEAIESILGQENQNQIANRFENRLREAAESFYTNLVYSVNPQAILTFEFAEEN